MARPRLPVGIDTPQKAHEEQHLVGVDVRSHHTRFFAGVQQERDRRDDRAIGLAGDLSARNCLKCACEPVLDASVGGQPAEPEAQRFERRMGDRRAWATRPIPSLPWSTRWKEKIMSGIKNKVIVITGASSGIGEATALLLAERGAKVVPGSRRSERLEALAVRIADAGGTAAHAPADVRRREDLTGLVALARERFGKLDVLINNAGVMPISPLDDLRVEDWEAMIDVNIKGVLYGIAAALPVFRQQGFGHFVNTASTAAYRVVPNMSVYSGTKMAVRAISEGLRQEAGSTLRVTIISPGMTRTSFADSMTDPEVKAQLTKAVDQVAMPPAAIARAIAFAIEQPADVDVSEVVVRPTAQG